MSLDKGGSPPSYRHYKRTNQAVVTLDGKDYYLGEYGSAESKKKYARLIEAWLARKEQAQGDAAAAPPLAEVEDAPSVNEIILAYLKHAATYYKPTAEG